MGSRAGAGEPLLSRRSLLLGGAGAVLLAACSNDADTNVETGGTSGEGTEPIVATTLAPGTLALRALFDSSPECAKAGFPQRLCFGLFDFEGAPYADGPAELDFTLYFEAEPEASGDPLHEAVQDGLIAPRRDEGIPRSYYAVRLTPPQPGVYTLETALDGKPLTAAFQASPPDDPGPVQVGQPMVVTPTATFDDPLGVDPICTRDPEPCPFHDQSLEALLGKGPVAFLISTPAYCQVGICGPVLDLLVAAAPDHPGVSFVHSEVYKTPADNDPMAGGLVPVIDAYGLSFEPVLFLADADGNVVERLDNIFDTVELSESLARLEA